MGSVYERLNTAYESVRDKVPYEPRVGLVLGSGLGNFADSLSIDAVIDYKDIKGFPVSTAPGHKGRFVFAKIEGVPVVCMQGRVHYYEGYDMEQVVLPIRLMALMGMQTLFVTNASGGIRRGFKAGQLVLITDHIATFMPSPLRGPNVSEIGVRFPDMSHVYDPALADIAKKTAARLDIPLKEGVYLQSPGPQYETPSEIEAFRTLGADLVGMSTACEAIAANHMGRKIIGISLVSNLAAGISPEPLSEQEVLDAGAAAAPMFSKLVKEVISQL